MKLATSATVVVIGGGPAGLTAATALAARGAGSVILVEREAEAGGIPRHCHHLGYGIRDLRRMLSGPAYAALLSQRARAAGVDLRTETMVTGWAGERTLEITSPAGRYQLGADAVVIATGARERPRPARLVPGDRPRGILTTGHLQNLVHRSLLPIGTRAVVVGAELVSWSAVMTLRAAGCATVAMTTEHPRSEAPTSVRVAGAAVLRTPVLTRTKVVGIRGRGRVSAVEIEDQRFGVRREIACDTVVFTGDWIPDHELVRLGGIDLDPATLGPRVDGALSTNRGGVFAAGNLLHPVETADVAALDGRHVADSVLRFLGAPAQASLPQGVRLEAGAGFDWVSPQLIRAGQPPPRGRLVLWPNLFRRFPVVRAIQDGREVGSVRLTRPAAPGRAFGVPVRVLTNVDPRGGPVTIGL